MGFADSADYRARLSREVSNLDKDFFFPLRVELSAVENLENRHFLVESLSEILLQVRIEDVPSPFEDVLPLFAVDVALDDVLGAGSLYERKPSDRGFAGLVGHDFHAVSVLEFVVERNDLSVRLGDHQMVAQIRMDGIREIHRGRAAGEVHYRPLGRENEDAVVEKGDLHLVHQLAVCGLFEDFLEFAYPVDVLGDA